MLQFLWTTVFSLKWFYVGGPSSLAEPTLHTSLDGCNCLSQNFLMKTGLKRGSPVGAVRTSTGLLDSLNLRLLNIGVLVPERVRFIPLLLRVLAVRPTLVVVGVAEHGGRVHRSGLVELRVHRDDFPLRIRGSLVILGQHVSTVADDLNELRGRLHAIHDAGGNFLLTFLAGVRVLTDQVSVLGRDFCDTGEEPFCGDVHENHVIVHASRTRLKVITVLRDQSFQLLPGTCVVGVGAVALVEAADELTCLELVLHDHLAVGKGKGFSHCLGRFLFEQGIHLTALVYQPSC
jgi:hypothetical protein